MWLFLFGRVTPSSENPNGATCSVSQGKPSLRRIKGRIHRSKSLDSIDFCEFTVSTLYFMFILSGNLPNKAGVPLVLGLSVC